MLLKPSLEVARDSCKRVVFGFLVAIFQVKVSRQPLRKQPLDKKSKQFVIFH